MKSSVLQLFFKQQMFGKWLGGDQCVNDISYYIHTSIMEAKK
jgi:hypothetical protein